MNDAEIKSLIENLLRSIPVNFDSIDIELDPITQNKVFTIKTQDSGLLIGDRGENFYALSHIIKRIAEKNPKEGQPQFFIEVNDYRASLAEKLKTKAKILAARAKDMKSNVELEPMSSYERLIIHGALTDEPNIKTESQGEGRNRRVIIKYIEQI